MAEQLESISRRVIVFTDYPARQRIPLFNELHRQCEELGYSLLVVFQSSFQAQRRWWSVPYEKFHFHYQILNETNITTRGASFYLPVKLFATLPKLRGRVFVFGGFSFPTVMASIYAQWAGVPFIIWSGAIKTGKGPANRFRKLVRRILVQWSDAFITYGTTAAEYLIRLGAKKERVRVAMNTVDLSYYLKETDRIRLEGTKVDGFQEYNFNFLCVTRFIKVKGVDRLLSAFSRIKSIDRCVLHLVGAGPEQEQCERLADELGIGEKVKFWGFKQEKELPLFYAASHVFVFPTMYDPWGLVLNEAMAAGLPVIASTRAGATRDLIIDGYNGFAVDPQNIDALSEKMNYCLNNHDRLPEIGLNGRKTILEKATIANAARGFIEAITLVG